MKELVTGDCRSVHAPVPAVLVSHTGWDWLVVSLTTEAGNLLEDGLSFSSRFAQLLLQQNIALALFLHGLRIQIEAGTEPLQCSPEFTFLAQEEIWTTFYTEVKLSMQF